MTVRNVGQNGKKQEPRRVKKGILAPLSLSSCPRLGGLVFREPIHMTPSPSIKPAVICPADVSLISSLNRQEPKLTLCSDKTSKGGNFPRIINTNISLIILFTISGCFSSLSVEYEWSSWAQPGAKPRLNVSLRNPQKTMAGGLEDVMLYMYSEHTNSYFIHWFWFLLASNLSARNLRGNCYRLPPKSFLVRLLAEFLNFKCFGEFRWLVLALCLRLMLTFALFVSLCFQQIDGAVAQIDRSSAGSHSTTLKPARVCLWKCLRG